VFKFFLTVALFNVQDLGLQLQELQASCILNAEKMKLNIEILRARDQEARVFRADQKKKISRLEFLKIFSRYSQNWLKTRLQDRVRTLSAEYRQQQHQTSQRRKNLRTRVNKLKAETIAANASSTSNPVTKTQLKMLSKHYAKQATTLVKKVKMQIQYLYQQKS
jgi:hypothetical protein